MEQIDAGNTDEIASQFYQKGENYFKAGQFQKALDMLLQCVRTPKAPALIRLDVMSYNLLGVIYGYLGQEILSKENFLKALEIGRECGYQRNMILSYIDLGYLHEKLNDLEAALSYESEAMKLLKTFDEDGSGLEMMCLVYQGMTHDKLGEQEKSAECLAQIDVVLERRKEKYYKVPVLDLALRVSYNRQDKAAFTEYFKKFLDFAVSEEKFIGYSEFYFDICAFLMEHDMPQELRQLLDYMSGYVNHMPLAYLKYHVYSYELSYAKKYSAKEEYWKAVWSLLAILPEYEEEQQRAKLYSFDYIEFLHEERNLSAKMEQKSKLDPMTGLFNKYTIESLIDEYFAQKSENQTAALLLIDMDHFKLINDTLGHLAGDSVLADTAMIIRRFFKENALCGRIGGDEFMIFVKEVRDMSSLVLQAEFLRQEIAKTTLEHNITISIQASVGIALSNSKHHSYADIYASADEALYRAKKEGRNKIALIE